MDNATVGVALAINLPKNLDVQGLRDKMIDTYGDAVLVDMGNFVIIRVPDRVTTQALCVYHKTTGDVWSFGFEG